MKKIIDVAIIALLLAGVTWLQESRAGGPSALPPCWTSGPVTTVSAVDICSGTTVADVPVSVTAFNNIGIMSLKLSYDPDKLGTPVLLSRHPDLWSTFVVNVPSPGIILVSGYGNGLTIGGTSTLFTLRFTRLAGLVSGEIIFVENVQGSSCEYAPDVPPDYPPFNDLPMGSFYIPGGITVHPQAYVPVTPLVSDLQANGQNIRWYSTESGGSALAPSVILVSGSDYWASQTINGCESTGRFKVTATIDPTPCAPTAMTPQTFALAAEINDLTTLTGTNIRWYSVSNGGSPLMPEAVLADGVYYCTQTIDCTESAARFAVLVDVP